MEYPDFVESNQFNFWNNKPSYFSEYLNSNLELNNFFCTYTPPIDAENYAIFQHFMEDRIQSPTFFFHELFPLLKFSDISFIFLYNTCGEESLVLANCKAMAVVFKESCGTEGLCLHCYTFAREALIDTRKSIIYFLEIQEYNVPKENIIIHDSTELGSFYECITRMKESAVSTGLYFPSGFAEMLPEGDYIREDFLNKNEAFEKYNLKEKDFKIFFILFFNLRFPGQVNFFEIGIYYNNIKSKRIDRIELSDFKKTCQISDNPRFLVFISSSNKDNGDEEISPSSHELKILIDRKFKKIVIIDSAVDIFNEFSLDDFKTLFANKLLEKNIIDITMYSVEESIVSFLNNDFYENRPKDESESKPSEPSEPSEPVRNEDYEPEDNKLYYRGNRPINREAPSVIYLQIMFQEKSSVKYIDYCIFLSWWMLFIILKLNEYNWKSFTQIAGEDLNKLVEEKNKDFIGNILFLVMKTIKSPQYKTASRKKDKNRQSKIIRENFIVQNVLNPNAPASRFGCENKEL